MEPFFFSVLLNLSAMGAIPAHGWYQSPDIGYETVHDCIFDMPRRVDEVYDLLVAVGVPGHAMPHAIDDMQCLTKDEWLEKNRALGHKDPGDAYWEWRSYQ